MNGSAYSILGDTEIIGDPASMVTEADKSVTEYLNKGFKLSDKIWVGVGNRTVITAGNQGQITTQVSNPFKPMRVCTPSQYAPDGYIMGFEYGAVRLFDGAPVVLDAFTEAANLGDVSWPTVQTSQNMVGTIRNDSATDNPYDLALYGIRLRQ